MYRHKLFNVISLSIAVMPRFERMRRRCYSSPPQPAAPTVALAQPTQAPLSPGPQKAAK
jgi:hypothetical protein